MSKTKPFGLAKRLRAGEPCFTAWIGMPSPLHAEALAREDFDCITFDMQHATTDLMNVIMGISNVVMAGKPACVRLALNDFGTGARLLDVGCECLIAPMINSVEDAKAFVSAVKYPPVGERSWGGVRVMQLSQMDGNTYIKSSKDTIVALAMIETKAALAAIHDILAVDGIDGVFAGPSDLSIALSNGADLNPMRADVDEAFATILAAARKANKIAGCFSPNAVKAKELAEKGWGLISIATDSGMLKAGAQAALKAAGR